MGTNFINTPLCKLHYMFVYITLNYFKVKRYIKFKVCKNFKSDFRINLSSTRACARTIKQHFAM
jgi:hypothetical protein